MKLSLSSMNVAALVKSTLISLGVSQFFSTAHCPTCEFIIGATMNPDDLSGLFVHELIHQGGYIHFRTKTDLLELCSCLRSIR